METTFGKGRIFGGIITKVKDDNTTIIQIINEENDPAPEWTQVWTEYSIIELDINDTLVTLY